MKQYRIDLHTHSKLSPDGSIDEKDYQKVLSSEKLDFVAITDHNTIEYALFCQKKLGQQVIVGEEISTLEGHLIGLFLKSITKPNQDVLKTAQEVKSQGGLVYVPHPFDIFRHGIGRKNLERIQQYIDIVETVNGRMIVPYFNYQAKIFATNHQLLSGFGSDGHDKNSLGNGALLLENVPTSNTSSFKNGIILSPSFSLMKFFAPKYNTIKKYLSL